MTIAVILPQILAECGLDIASPSVGSQDFSMRQIVQLMNAAGKDINTRTEWSRGLTTQVVAGGASSALLNDDFQEMAESGAVKLNKTPYEPVRPVVDPTLWQFLEATPSTTQTYYRLKGGRVHFAPPLDADGATIEYVSRHWLVGDKSQITDDADETIFPEDLLTRGTIWRWRRQKSLSYEDLMAEFEADLEAAMQADRGIK